MEIETSQLRETLAEYNVEMAGLKQRAGRVGEVEERLEEYEKSMEDSIDTEIKAKEEKLDKMFEEKVAGLEEEKVRTDQKLHEAEQKAKSLQAQVDESQNELFELRGRQEQRRAAITDDMELLLTDLDRANQRAQGAEKEVALLQDRLQEIKEATPLEEEDQELGQEASELRAQLQVKNHCSSPCLLIMP